ncbi:HAMP domain-containing protein [Aquabacterium lacunae]|uniref:HAMP domain-containing protein n=1 Tax=Aquabacterium lacunae TaxID=2528630 RepID=A0A4Q9H4J9_9BURK|nr:methyl-accepting chemotaxis protein [Aquabacterium lacunae]TBO31492.1 HAMP domain-containing protein [Aquabacterium lacunae]
MSVLTKFKVSHRLALGFGLVSAMLSVVCAVGVFNAQRAKGLIESELLASQTLQTEALAMLSAVLQQDISVRNIGLLTDPNAMQGQANEARKANKAVGAIIERVGQQQLNERDRAMLAEIRQLNDKSVPVTDEAIGFAVSYQPEDAVNVINGQLDGLSQKRRALVMQFADHQRARTEAVSQSLVKGARNAAMLMLGVGLTGLVLAVAAAMLVGRSITQPLRDANHAARRVAEGDLTVDLKADSRDEIGELVGAMGAMADSLRRMIATMRQSAENIHMASAEIASGNQDLSIRTEQQASSLQSTVSTVTGITETVRHNALSARQASELAVKAATVAEEGGNRVNEVVRTMDAISDSSRKISDIVGVIDGIAFQTNILALNAAVEAARAGEQGRGFAVVASEVRSLAQRSANAAREIKTLISSNVEKVETGSRLVTDAGSTMSDIVSSSQRVAQIVSEITQATTEQAQGLELVHMAIGGIDQATQQNAALVEQAAAAAESLKDQTRSLNDAVAIFKTDANSRVEAALF